MISLVWHPSRGSDAQLSLGVRLIVAAVLSIVLVSGCARSGTAVSADRVPTAGTAAQGQGPDPKTYPGGRAFLYGTRVRTASPQPSASDVIHEVPVTTADHTISDFAEQQVKVGVYGDPTAKRTIALAGGSHAEMWISALDILGKRNNFRVLTYLKMGCPLSTDQNPVTLEGQPYPGCRDWSARVLERLVHDHPDALFTTATRPNFDGRGDVVPTTYVAAFDQIIKAGIPILGLRDTPWPRTAEKFIDTPICLMSGGDASSCGSPRDVVLSSFNPAQSLSSRLFHPLDLSDGLCSDDLCPAIVGNLIVYKDQHHVSATFVRSLTDELGRQMKQALPWIGSSK